MKIELTPLQIDRLIIAANEKFLEDPKQNIFWLGLQHNLERQKKENTKNFPYFSPPKQPTHELAQTSKFHVPEQ